MSLFWTTVNCFFRKARPTSPADYGRCDLTLDVKAQIPASVPPEWLDVRVVDNTLTFIDTCFSEMDIASRVGAIVGGVRSIDAQPVALRSIYTTLARAGRGRRPPQ
jgi:hypothetical protein